MPEWNPISYLRGPENCSGRPTLQVLVLFLFLGEFFSGCVWVKGNITTDLFNQESPRGENSTITYPALGISKSQTATADSFQKLTITASGGTSQSYTYSISSGTAAIDSSSGIYSPSSARGIQLVQVTDSQRTSTAQASIYQIPVWADGTVNAALIVGNDIYLGGTFTSFGRAPTPRFAALDSSTGNITALGCSLQENFNGAVNVVLKADTAIFVGGAFTKYKNLDAYYLAKLDANCDLDQTFTQSGSNGGFDSSVSALAVSGNSIYVGGAFTQYRSGNYGANSSRFLAKLDQTSGALDQTFTQSGVNGGCSTFVTALAVSGTSLYVGGGFTAYRSGTNGANSANNLAKINLTTGVLDQTFTQSGANGGFDSSVLGLTILGNSIYAGGAFTQYRSGTYGSFSANYLAKLNLTSGALDQTFTQAGSNAGFNNYIAALASDSSTIYAGGGFTQYRSGTYAVSSANYLAKVNLTTGALDRTFTQSGTNGGFNGAVKALATDGTSLFVGGSFTQYRFATYGATSANYLAKLDMTSGNLDQVFTSSGANGGFNNNVNGLVVSGDITVCRRRLHAISKRNLWCQQRQSLSKN